MTPVSHKYGSVVIRDNGKRNAPEASEYEFSIGIVASRSAKVNDGVITKVVSILAAVPKNGRVCTRVTTLAGLPSSPIELFVWEFASGMGLYVQGWGAADKAPEALLERDRLLARATKDGLFAFFPEEKLLIGGTGHVVKAALDLGFATEAYEVQNDGSVKFGGALDKDDPLVILLTDGYYPQR